MPLRRLLLPFFALLFAVVLPAAAAERDLTHERWYVALLDGNRVGYMHSRVAEEGERITTSAETKLTIQRGPISMTLTVETEFVETERGEPISAVARMNMGAMGTQETRWTFKDRTHLIQEIKMGSASTTQEIELPGESWLTPHAVGEFVEARLKAGAEAIEFTTVDVTLGTQLVTARQEILERTTVEAMGKTVPALKTRSTISALPGMSTTDFVDPQTGEPIRTDINMGFGVITMLAADKELALSKTEPTELMVSTLVTPTGQEITKPRASKRATYVLSLPAGEKLADVPTTAAQTAERLDDQRIRVTVDVGAARAEPDPTLAEQALEDSAFVSHTDPAIIALTKKATQEAGEDRKDRAKAIRKFVYDYIERKSLDVGFASASETAQTREGDCSEHAVLMAAMLRADGIPSRVASGLIFADQFLGADGVFGYHMWTQALLADDEGVLRWVDFDPSWPNRFDATHILLSTSLMDSTQSTPANDMVVLIPLLGQLQVEVVEVE